MGKRWVEGSTNFCLVESGDVVVFSNRDFPGWGEEDSRISVVSSHRARTSLGMGIFFEARWATERTLLPRSPPTLLQYQLASLNKTEDFRRLDTHVD